MNFLVQEAQLSDAKAIINLLNPIIEALAAYLNQGLYEIGIARKHAKIHEVYIDEVMIERFL